MMAGTGGECPKKGTQRPQKWTKYSGKQKAKVQSFQSVVTVGMVAWIMRHVRRPDVSRQNLNQGDTKEKQMAKHTTADGRVLGSDAEYIVYLEQAHTETLAELERSKAKSDQATTGDMLVCKVGQSGAVSVYGLQRNPVTLYGPQWLRLLAKVTEITAFISTHTEAGHLAGKNTDGTPREPEHPLANYLPPAERKAAAEQYRKAHS